MDGASVAQPTQPAAHISINVNTYAFEKTLVLGSDDDFGTPTAEGREASGPFSRRRRFRTPNKHEGTTTKKTRCKNGVSNATEVNRWEKENRFCLKCEGMDLTTTTTDLHEMDVLCCSDGRPNHSIAQLESRQSSG